MKTQTAARNLISTWTKRTTPFLRWVVTICLAALVPVAAQAATFNIPNGDVAGLIAALNTANGNGEADTINLASSGTYILTAVNNTSSYRGPNGLPAITSQITINGNGATIQRSSAAGTPDFRILLNLSGDVTLNAVTIAGGKAAAGAPGYKGGGGGIRNEGAVLIRNSTVKNNSGTTSGYNDGGGIFNYLGAG